jgi:hypothetical protein
MLGKLSIFGAVAGIFMIPTALSAQMGGAVNPGVHVGGAANPGALPFAVPSSEVFLARIWGLGGHPLGQVHRTRKHSVRIIKQHRRCGSPRC